MEPFLAEIRIMAFDYPPNRWAHCDGQFMPINQHQALFALLGTAYGGNGQTTFRLPDLQGRVAVGYGVSGYHAVGISGGAESHTVTLNELPAHTHVVQATSSPADADNGNIPSASSLPAGSVGQTVYGSPSAHAAMSAQTVSSVGGSQPHLNMMPYTSLNFCIALEGIFPSRP